jgi:hypothetical protein
LGSCGRVCREERLSEGRCDFDRSHLPIKCALPDLTSSSGLLMTIRKHLPRGKLQLLSSWTNTETLHKRYTTRVEYAPKRKHTERASSPTGDKRNEPIPDRSTKRSKQTASPATLDDVTSRTTEKNASEPSRLSRASDRYSPCALVFVRPPGTSTSLSPFLYASTVSYRHS